MTRFNHSVRWYAGKMCERIRIMRKGKSLPEIFYIVLDENGVYYCDSLVNPFPKSCSILLSAEELYGFNHDPQKMFDFCLEKINGLGDVWFVQENDESRFIDVLHRYILDNVDFPVWAEYYAVTKSHDTCFVCYYSDIPKKYMVGNDFFFQVVSGKDGRVSVDFAGMSSNEIFSVKTGEIV